MPRKRHSPEQILGKLREVEVALANTGAVRRSRVVESWTDNKAGDGSLFPSPA